MNRLSNADLFHLIDAQARGDVAPGAAADPALTPWTLDSRYSKSVVPTLLTLADGSVVELEWLEPAGLGW